MAARRRTSRLPLASLVTVLALAAALGGCEPPEELEEELAPEAEVEAVDPATLEPVEGAAEGVYAFTGVHVIPLDRDGVLEDHTVVVQDGRIVEMGPADQVEAPEDAQVVEGNGRYLIPGLAEMHAHVSPDPDTPDEEHADILFLFLSNGITTIRGMLGAPHQLELRDAIVDGEVLGPSFVVGAPSINGNTAPTPEDAERLVREYAEDGYDFLKIHPGVERAVWDHMVEVAQEVGITFAGHVPSAVGIRHALETGISTVDHLDGYLDGTRADDLPEEADPLERFLATDPEKVHELAELTTETGAWVVPTMYLWENFFDPVDVDSVLALPEMQYVPTEMREGWAQMNRNRWENQREQYPDLDWEAAGRAHADARVQILEAIHAAGADILLGTDAPQMFNVPGFALHREVPIMARAGMSPHEILASGSVEVARYVEEELGLPGDFGTVSAGQRADLVLLGNNPLEDLEHLRDVEGVMVRGLWLSGEEIRERLDALADDFAA